MHAKKYRKKMSSKSEVEEYIDRFTLEVYSIENKQNYCPFGSFKTTKKIKQNLKSITKTLMNMSVINEPIISMSKEINSFK